jgi:TolA-binding protein
LIRFFSLKRAISVSILVLVCLPLFSALGLRAGEIDELNFARKLLRDGMYIAAAEEFLRFSENHPDSKHRQEALISAGEAYMRAGRASDALRAFDAYVASYPAGQEACKAIFYRGRIFKALKRYGDASGEFLSVADRFPDCPYVGQALLEAGDCLLSAGEAGEAAAVLRRLVYGRESSDMTPRGMLSLSLALEKSGRDLEALKVLEELIDKYPDSPVAALAMLSLAEKEFERGDAESAIDKLRRIEKRFEEEALRERASLLAIRIYSDREDDRALFEEAIRFLDRYPESERRGSAYVTAIETAERLGEHERLIELARSYSEEEIFVDPAGKIALHRARALTSLRRTEDALRELERFRRAYGQSELLPEAYALEADLRSRSGDPMTAIKLYNLLLLEPVGDHLEADALESMAELSLAQLADTSAAIRYLRSLVDDQPFAMQSEKALFDLARLYEALGDEDEAGRAYSLFIKRFPESSRAEEARRRIEGLELRIHWGAEDAAELAKLAASEGDVARRSLDAGVLSLDRAGDAAMAIGLIERAIGAGLADTDLGKAKYKLGEAYILRARILESAGKNGDGDRKRALELWLETAREYIRTEWGGMAHRAYVEEKSSEWNSNERVARIDEYLSFYNEGENRWWALGEKVDVLYGIAQRGDSTSLDLGLSLSDQIIRSDAPAEIRREAALKRAYLFRLTGDLGKTSSAFADFLSRFEDDERSAPVLFDLGESYLGSKRYEEACDAFDRCIASQPSRSLAERCFLRRGDCRYYLRRFDEAARIYNEFSEAYAESDLAGEARFREALAREQMGDGEAADGILTELSMDESLPSRLEIKVLGKLGRRRLDQQRFDEARRYLEELLSYAASYETYLLLARAQFGSGDNRGSAESFSRALGFEDADSCEVLTGRARALIRIDDSKRALDDLANLLNRCPGYDGAAAVFLEKGIREVEQERCSDADSTFSHMRKYYGNANETNEALYYEALCDLKRGGYESGAQKLESFLRAAPASPLVPQAYFKLAGAQFAAGKYNLAARNFALAAEAFGDDDRAYLAWRNLGRVYQELEDWEKAAETWKRISESYPGKEETVEVLFNLGFSYNQTGRHELAYEVYKRVPNVSTTDEQRGRAHYWAGISLKNLGRYSEAVREFLRVPYLRTGGMWGVTSKLEAAGCYERVGETEEAKKIYEDVVRSHGSGSDWGRVASEALERIAAEEGRNPDSSKGGEGRPNGS